MTAKTRFMGMATVIFTLAFMTPGAHGQQAHEDLTACPGSAPEPAQTGAWSVAFCNRTGHDVVLEFHDNECPAENWSRRGDVYQRTLRRGESKSFPLCYASESSSKQAAPGTPAIRLPGGKGVITTWSVVGDCGEHSRPLSLEGRSFYDRGEYKSGIILLQYPADASHCVAEAAATTGASGVAGAAGVSSATATAAPSHAAVPTQPPTAPAQTPASAHSSAPAPPAATSAAAVAAPVSNRGSGTPALSATIDTKDAVARTVRVFAKDGAGYKCNFNLALTFTDGATWNDHGNAAITGGDVDAPIATRKYLKSVAKVQITSSRCSPG